MRAEEVVVVVDAGSSSTRALVYNRGGEVLYRSQRQSETAFSVDGKAEQTAEQWQGGLIEVLRATQSFCDSKKCSPQLIALTSFRSPVLPLDRKFQALHPALMWQDRRSEAICQRLNDDASRIFELTGCPLSTVTSLGKILWLKEERPDIFARTKYLERV